jgi:hypothetical protein
MDLLDKDLIKVLTDAGIGFAYLFIFGVILRALLTFISGNNNSMNTGWTKNYDALNGTLQELRTAITEQTKYMRRQDERFQNELKRNTMATLRAVADLTDMMELLVPEEKMQKWRDLRDEKRVDLEDTMLRWDLVLGTKSREIDGDSKPITLPKN